MISFWQFSTCKNKVVASAKINLDEHRFDTDLKQDCFFPIKKQVERKFEKFIVYLSKLEDDMRYNINPWMLITL